MSAERPAASVSESRRVTSRAEKWELIERWCEHYPDDWRLLFQRVTDKTEHLEVQVPEEVWRAFDGIRI